MKNMGHISKDLRILGPGTLWRRVRSLIPLPLFRHDL